MSSFAQARADVASAMDKLTALDRVFGMMDEFATLLAGIGQHPELAYDLATGRLTLAVVVGRIPPRLSLAVEEAVPALPAPSKPPASSEKPVSATRLTQFKTGPWTEEELDQAAELVGQGMTNKEVAAKLNRPATGIHFKLDPLRKALAEEAEREAEEGLSPAAAESPAPVGEVAVPSVLLIEGCADPFDDEEPSPRPSPAGLTPAAGLTMAERHAWDLLDDIADARWPASRDLDMLERMMRGDGAAATAEGMGAEKPAIVARWRRLFPGGVSIAQQERLVRVLKLRVAAEVAT